MTIEPFEPAKTSIQLHYVYAHADGVFSNELEKHLAILQRQGIITEWHSHEITPATDGEYVFDEYLATAQVILVLISPDFFLLDFSYGVALRQAIERCNNGKAIVIPIILRHVNWENSPFGAFSAFPDNKEPVIAWKNQDEAYLNIMEGIQDEITSFLSSRPSKSKQKKLALEHETTLVSEQENTHSIELFYVYSGQDQDLSNQLEKHLVILQRQGVISAWASQNLFWRSNEENETQPNLNTAQIILLLISPDFLASDYIDSTEMGKMLERYQAGEATIIPIILRPTYWQITPLDRFPPLPDNGEPVTTWSNIDTAFANIVQGIRNVITTLPFSPPAKEEQEHIDIEETLDHMPVTSGPIKIFYSYAREDRALLDQLQTHLAALRRHTTIAHLDDYSVLAGQQREPALKEMLNAAHIILLLVSPDYLASNYLDSEMLRAIKRARTGEALVIPIILRPVSWADSPLSNFQVLPTAGKPVTTWEQLDEAFYDITQELRKVILSLSTRLNQETKEQFILAGKTYYDAHDYNAALVAYDRARSFDPKDEIVSTAIGRILLQLGRYEDALQVYEDLPSVSTPASTYLFKGIALQHLGRFTEALKAYQKAREYGFSG